MREETAMGVTGAVTAFLTDAEARNLSPRTLEYYRSQLGYFVAWLQAGGVDLAYLDNITPAAIRAYLVALRTRGLKDTSVHAAARAIRAWGFFCEREGLLTVSPMRRVKMPKVGKHILPALPLADVRALLGVCETVRDRAIILFLLDSGCRAAELAALNIGDVNMMTGEVLIRHGKGDKARRTYVEDDTRRALAEYVSERGALADGAPLWVAFLLFNSTPAAGTTTTNRTLTERRLTASGVRNLLKRLSKHSGVACSPHSFRRTCALQLHRSGARLTEIASILGHSDLPTLQRYLSLQPADIAAAHRQHSPVKALLQAAGGELRKL